MAQLDARPTGDQEVAGSTPTILSWRFDHKIFSTVILSLPLIQDFFFLLIVLGFNNTSTFVVILCCLPGKGRKEIEETVGEMKERDREERGTGVKLKKQKK